MRGKGRAPKLLLNQGPPEPCYATVLMCKILPLSAFMTEEAYMS